MDEKEIKDATVMVVDHGQFQEVASRLARDFKRVLYFKNWKKAAPYSTAALVGDGFPEFERVRNFWDMVDEVDLFVFPDLYDGDLQLHLESLGKRVWGSRKAEEFEFRREFFKETLHQVGLSVSPHEIVVGMTALRKFLKENDDQHIKISWYRGDSETWHHQTYELSQSKLNSLEFHYGPMAERMRFVVEKGIKTDIEIGYDGICIDGQFTDGFIDYEIKNKACIAAWKEYDDMDDTVRMVNDKFAPLLAEKRMRSMWGTEIRVAKDNTPFFIDATCRFPSPPGEMQLEMFENLSEIMWHGAVGEFVQAEPAAQFAVEIMFYANWQDMQYQPIVIPDKVRRWVKLSTACKVGDTYFCIPCQGDESVPWLDEELGAVVGIGDTIEDAIDSAKEHAEAVQGFNLDLSTDSLVEALSRIKAGESEGIEFTEQEVPEPASVLEG